MPQKEELNYTEGVTDKIRVVTDNIESLIVPLTLTSAVMLSSRNEKIFAAGSVLFMATVTWPVTSGYIRDHLASEVSEDTNDQSNYVGEGID